MSTHPDEILIIEFQAWRAERDAELRASAVRRRERERERYQRNCEARLAYARDFYSARKQHRLKIERRRHL